MENSEIIKRPIYLDRAMRLLDKGMMLIITGQRRVGKSYMLRQIKSELQERYADANVLYINKENLQFDYVHDYKSLYDYIKTVFNTDTRNYLLIDEVQEIEGFEYVLRSLQSENICQVIATGSNAKILSSDLTTLLGGRYIEIHVKSLTYTEFLVFHNMEDSDASLLKYLTYGGLPGLRKVGLEDADNVRDYLESVYNAIVLKDIVMREKIRNVRFLERLIKYVADNVGKHIALRNIANYGMKDKTEVSTTTVSTYLKYITNTYIADEVSKYDVHGRALLEQNATLYFQDLGLCNHLAGFSLAGHIEKTIENAIWHHLSVLGFKVCLGTLKKGEVDFVATKKEQTIYVQATYMVASEETAAREFGNLMQIKDNYPKYVVSMDALVGNRPDYPGIQHLHLRDFLKTTF